MRGKQSFTCEVEDIYTHVMDNLLRQYPQIRDGYYRLDDESIESVAYQLFKYFPSHYFKAYYSLLETEKGRHKNSANTNFINWPKSTLVDIGCGTGAVSVAYLSTLLQFQKFLLELNKSISPVEVFVIGMDTNEKALSIYEEMLGRLSKVVRPYLIRVKFTTIKGAFPNDISNIFHLEKPSNQYYSLVALSNIVRPLDFMFTQKETNWLEKIDQALLDEPRKIPSFGMAESRAIKEFLNKWNLEHLGILGIATKGANEQGKSWDQHLNDLHDQIVARLTPDHIFTHQHREGEQFRIVNPQSSYWKSQKGLLETPITYSWSYLHISSKNKIDMQWNEILKYENLELAWSRARQYALREALTDEMEVRLFDVDTDLKLARLRAYLLMHKWNCLNIEWLLQYDAPKSEVAFRPKTVARLEEQIASAAIIQLLGHDIERGNSYSYLLKRDRNEFLYEYWLHAWKQFIKETQEQAKTKQVLRADIKEFYKNIEQSKLLHRLETSLDAKGRVLELLEVLVRRNSGDNHKLGYGLPQGHIASGFWADLYLGRLDSLICEEFPYGLHFARYADDMFFAIDGNAENITGELQKYAETLKLELSDSKTHVQRGEDYIISTELDMKLQFLADERYEPLINTKIFRLSYELWRLFQDNENEFIAAYRTALRQISIHVSESWLRRKLHQNWFKAGNLQWPQMSILTEFDSWLSEFKVLNQGWLDDVKDFRQELQTICTDSYSKLQQPDLSEADKTKLQRRFRFSAHRICNLGAPDDLCEVFAKELIQNPWRVSARLLCPGLANADRVDLLLQVLHSAESSYVRALAAWSLGTVDYRYNYDFVEHVKRVLCSLLLDPQSTPHEKLKASEALVNFDDCDYLKFERLTKLIEQEENPYLLKNYLLLMNKFHSTKAQLYCRALAEESNSLIVIDVIQFILSNSRSLQDMQSEPGILKQYYSSFYPVAEADATMIEAASPQI